MNVCAGVFNKRNAPANPPIKLAIKQRYKYSPRRIKPVAIRSSARSRARPQRNRIGGVRLNRRDLDP